MTLFLRAQDVVINQLLSDVEAAEWKRNQMENTLLDEEQLTAGLRDAIRGAHAEIAAINTEKIRLNQSWQSSLLALQKNNQALAAVHQSIRFPIDFIFSFVLMIKSFATDDDHHFICAANEKGTKKPVEMKSIVAGLLARKKPMNWHQNGPTFNSN